MLKNRVVIIVDSSGSMHTIARKTVDVVNSWIEKIKQKDAEENQQSEITLITFSNSAGIAFRNVPSAKARYLTYNQYQPNGMTALMEAVMMGVDEAEDGAEGDTSFLLITVTDGYENCSSDRAKRELPKRLIDKQMQGNWTVTFLVPRGNKNQLIHNFRIPDDNVQEWDATERGAELAGQQTSIGLDNYYRARSMGASSVKSFYTMTTDLSGLKPEEVKQECHDISGDCQVLTVKTESEIKEFVEANAGITYKKGCAFYQLMKPETIQPTKEVLVMEKGKRKVWRGPGARQLIGLPIAQYAKVNPGNHANYDVFVQSTSTNRKLPRGTKVIVVNQHVPV